jgi:hypothetical protein
LEEDVSPEEDKKLPNQLLVLLLVLLLVVLDGDMVVVFDIDSACGEKSLAEFVVGVVVGVGVIEDVSGVADNDEMEVEEDAVEVDDSLVE